MPRHTHPPRRAKHSRADVRAQRERFISRRFRAAKREGTLDYLDPRARDHDDQAAEVFVADLNARFGYAGHTARIYGQVGWPHPEIIRNIPAAMRRRVDTGVVLGSFSNDRPRGWRCPGCSFCKPYRYEPGYRTRVKAADLVIITEGVNAWLDGDRGSGATTRPRREQRLLRGWC